MSKGVISGAGLKYVLSDAIYEKMMDADQGTNELWDRLNTVVENSELFPQFCSFVTFSVLALKSGLGEIEIILCSLLAMLVGTVLSNSVWIFKNAVVSIVLFCFRLLSKFLIHYIVMIALSIFVIKLWWVAPVFFVAQLILSFVLAGLIDGYESRKPFNDRAALALIKTFGEK